MKTCFVAGTDTGVGKTLVCGLLLRYLREKRVDARYLKWVATGCDDIPEDLVECHTAAGLPVDAENLDASVPYRFALPASPHLAAEAAGRSLDPELLLARTREAAASCETLLVEGAGGLLVPLTRELLLIDLVARAGLPVLLVARTGLGTLNHTLLSLEALRHRGIPCQGVVFSDSVVAEDERIAADNLATIAALGGVRVFGRLRRRTDQEARFREFSPIGHVLLQA